MRALVVYESMFGNTARVAAAIAEGLSTWAEVEVVEVGTAPATLADDVGLLVVGGPTHAFGMTRPQTRVSAGEQGAPDRAARGIGLREWLAAVQPPTQDVAALAFDTRIPVRWAPGSAARAARRRLHRLGFRTAGPAMSFYVTGTPGPLRDGELQRALAWGTQMRSVLSGSAA